MKIASVILVAVLLPLERVSAADHERTTRAFVLDEGSHAAIANRLDLKSAKLFFGVQRMMSEDRARSLKSEGTFQIEGFSFFSRRLPEAMESSVYGVVVRAFLRFDLHRPRPMSPTLCGGFHPDLAVVVEKAGRVTSLFLCLSCGEWEARSEGIAYSSDVDPVMAEALRLIHTFSFGHFAGANKALEPTPGSVTPRATERNSK